ncbi:hypothetical protein UF75_4701 [Desulfosporosinus sp. I2]|nr:hypothetical protein UF75_4701 [Desulfosporosinus sp. I2]
MSEFLKLEDFTNLFFILYSPACAAGLMGNAQHNIKLW